MPLNGTLHLSRSVRALAPREASLAPARRHTSFLPASSSSPPDRTTTLPTEDKNDTTMTTAPSTGAAPAHSSIIPSFYSKNSIKPKRQRESSASTATGTSPSSATTPAASSTSTPSAATTNSSTPQIPSSDPPVPETPASDACGPTPAAAGPSSAVLSMNEFEGIEELSDSDFVKLPVSTRKRRRRLNGSSTAPSSSVAPAPSSSVAPGSDAKPIDLSTSSPTERSSERLPSSSPRRRTPRKSRRRIIESDSEAEWSPPRKRRTSSPVKRASSPAKDPSPPVTRSSSPVKRAASPLKRASSPVKRTASPHSATSSSDDDGDDERDADVPPEEADTPRSAARPARSGRAVFNGYYAKDAANFEKAMGDASDDEPVRKSVRKSVPSASKAKSKSKTPSKTPPVEDDTEVDTDGSRTPTARDKGKGKELPSYFAEDELCSDESDDDEPLRKRLRKRRDADEDMFDEMDDAGIDYDALPFSEVGLEIADFPEFMSQMPRFRTPLDGEDDYPVADVEADEVSVASVQNGPGTYSGANGKTGDGDKDPSRMFGLHLIHYLPDEDLQAFYRNHWRRGADLSSEDEDNAAGITRAPPRKSFGNNRGPAFRGRGKAFRGRRGATRGRKRK